MSEPGGDGEPDGLDTVRPRRPLELFLLRLSPGLEGPLAELWKDLSEERKAREIERAGTFLDSVKGDEATLETIVRRMLESERVADLFEGAMDAACEPPWRRSVKRWGVLCAQPCSTMHASM